MGRATLAQRCRAAAPLAGGLVANARLRSEPSYAPIWVETMPSVRCPLTPSSPLCETERGGLDAREINEPDVFRHFFGARPR